MAWGFQEAEGPAHSGQGEEWAGGDRPGQVEAGVGDKGPRDQESWSLLDSGAIPMVCRARKCLRDSGQDLDRPRGREGLPRVCGVADKDAHRHGCSVSPQETGIPEDLLVTVVRPGLPTLADLHVLLPPPRPTRKRSLVSDKVSLAATRPACFLPHRGLGGR